MVCVSTPHVRPPLRVSLPPPCRSATTADAYAKFLRPRAQAAGARGYHLAAGLDGEVGPATVHVVHAHSRPVLELLDTLLAVAAHGPDTAPNSVAFFHVDVLVDDPDPSMRPPDRCTLVAAGIAAVGRTIVLTSPWEHPAWTAEARCLFEAYAGLRTPPSDLTGNCGIATGAGRGGGAKLAGRCGTAPRHSRHVHLHLASRAHTLLPP